MDAYKGKIYGEIDGLKIPFINIQDFITNKKASGRDKDLGDLQLFKKEKAKTPKTKRPYQISAGIALL